MENGTITRRLGLVLNGLDKEFSSLYVRKDFEQKLDALKKAGRKSNRPSILAGLFAMFDACGIQYEKGRENAYYEKLVQQADIPDFSEMEDRMLYALYSRYQEYPLPQEYMLRIVDRLSDREDGWGQDTLRVRILKQFIKYGNYLADVADGGKKAVGGRTTVRNYVKKKLGKSPSEADVLKYLDDGVFGGFEAETAQAKSRAAQMEYASKAEKKKAREQVKALGKLNGKFGLLKLADDLAAGKFRTEGATKRCLYWFAMVYGMTYYTGAYGEMPDYESDIEKNLFQDYYTNNLMRFLTDAYKGRLSEYELDPSGQGINYKNFAEVIYLYYISSDHSPQEKIKKSAEMINRVRNHGNRAQGSVAGQPDAENTYMAAQADAENAYMAVQADAENAYMAVQADAENAYMAVQADAENAYMAVQADAENTYMEAQSDVGRGTAYFRGFFRKNTGQELFYEDVLKLTEEEFEQFVMENYDCSTMIGADGQGTASGRIVGELQIETAQDTAFENYRLIKNKLDGLHGADSCNYGLWFTDLEAFRKKGDESICDRRADVDREKFHEFMDLLSGINSFLTTKAFVTEKPEAVTRTSMVTAYYYYYNALHENDGNGKWKNFGELFCNFKQGIDRFLESSYYQPLSGKNIFDVLVVFSAYAYLNI